MVSTHSIRYRILKVATSRLSVYSSVCFNPFDPIQDTESFANYARPCALSHSFNPFDPIQDTERTGKRGNLEGYLECFNPFDPIQDTESRIWHFVQPRIQAVSTHSIRYRILKVLEYLTGTSVEGVVSTHSIRYRILKEGLQARQPPAPPRFNPFDPIQDTESDRYGSNAAIILCFNPFDPIQDTESAMLDITFVLYYVSTHSIRYRILKGT